jgi:Mn2+/Fe2+ NRAMP family transporter
MKRAAKEINILEKIGRKISGYGPAIFMIGAVIGTGSVSSLVVAGTEYGMNLIWALLLSCIFFWVLIGSISRLTFASGKTFVTLVNEQFGKVAGFYIVLAITVGQFTSNIGVLGIVSEAFASWTGFDFLGSAAIWCTVVYLMILAGQYAAFERILIIFVTILGISFMVNLFLAPPTVESVLRGFIPTIPAGGAVIAGAMVGTTLAGSVIVMRSFVVTDKGWTIKDLRHANRDAVVSGFMVFIVSAAVMACAAATLYLRGLHIEKAIDMAYTLIPLMGKFAATLFVTGIIAAGLSSAFPNALVSIWTISEYFGLSRDPRAIHFRLLALFFVGAGLIAPLTGGKPVLLQIVSLAIQAIFLPLLVFFILLLLNKEALAGQYRNSRFINMMTIITLLFSLFMAYQAFSGLVTLL